MRVDGVLRTEMLALLSVHARRTFLNQNYLSVAMMAVRLCYAATCAVSDGFGVAFGLLCSAIIDRHGFSGLEEGALF